MSQRLEFAHCQACGRALIHGDCILCDLPLAAQGPLAMYLVEVAREREGLLRRSEEPARSASVEERVLVAPV